MKVQILAYKGFIIINPLSLEGDSVFNPADEKSYGSSLFNTKETLGVSLEALELMKKIKIGSDGIGDIAWRVDYHNIKGGKSEEMRLSSFIWFGPLYRIIDPDKAVAARTFRILENECQIIPNNVSDSMKKKVLRTVGRGDVKWNWPYNTSKKPHQGLVYLSMPLRPFDSDEDTRNAGNGIVDMIAKLNTIGVTVISPSIQGLAIEARTTGWEGWKDLCENIMIGCEAVYVTKIDGYENSLIVNSDMLTAAINGIPCYLLDPVTLEIEEIKAKKPINMMSIEDIKELCKIFEVEYHHHDSKLTELIERNIEKGHNDDHNNYAINVYPSSHGMLALTVLPNGKILRDPLIGKQLDFMFDTMKDLVERLKNDAGLDPEQIKEMQRHNDLREKRAKEAEAITSKYHLF